jgi:hypothetical protein
MHCKIESTTSTFSPELGRWKDEEGWKGKERRAFGCWAAEESRNQGKCCG